MHPPRFRLRTLMLMLSIVAPSLGDEWSYRRWSSSDGRTARHERLDRLKLDDLDTAPAGRFAPDDSVQGTLHICSGRAEECSSAHLWEPTSGRDDRFQPGPNRVDERPIPKDFKIVAEFSPPITVFNPDPWRSWKTTITGDGRACQEVRGRVLKREKGEERSFSLSKGDLRGLADKVEEADFFQLDKEYSYAVSHGDTVKLTITRDGKTQSVKVFAPQFGKGNPEIQRFMKVWSEILGRVPSPNKDQKSEDYLK